MKIGFLAVNASDAGCTFRAKWPAQWINKFTAGHSAFFVTANDIGCSEPFSLFRKCDAVVIHKTGKAFVELVRKIKKHYPHIAIIFDSDDYDPIVWDYYAVDRYFHRISENWAEMLDLADGFIGASLPLAQRVYAETGKPCACVENGFDLSLTQYRGRAEEYFSTQGPDGEFVKVVYAGGNNHYRELGMLFEWGIMDELADAYPVDFHFYGILKQGGMRIKRNKGGLYTHNGASMDSYIKSLYADAAFLLAPLCDDPFNDYRSTIKLVEAGVAGKTCIASNRAQYVGYHTPRAVTVIENNREAWYQALKEHIEAALGSSSMLVDRGEANRKGVEEYNDAQYLTNQRIEFLTTLKAKK